MAATWKIPNEWPGETCFIVGGGTSVAYQRTERLRGRKIIAINSSYETVPFADFLFFGDNRWWMEHQNRDSMKNFKGRIVTVSYPATSSPPGRLLKLERITPMDAKTGFTSTRVGLSSQKTSMQGAMNLAAMLGAKRLVLLGLDGTRGANGLAHHHKPHKWKVKPGDITWDLQYTQLRLIVEPLKALGVEVFNTSPASRCNFWPIVPLERFL